MKRIRIGKDIEIHWPILTNGEQFTLEGRDLHLVLHLPSCMETPLHFEPQGNIAVFTISGNMQKQLGAYRLTMWENKDKSGQTAVDYCDAFELVPTTCMEGGNDNNLTTETVNLDSSDLIVGLPGPSAYDLYKKHNPDAEISEEEYANAPIDAADAANEAAKAANEAVDKIGDINEALAGKVDKEEGKGLSSNDYTDDDKEKLDGLSNYDDTEIRVQLSEKASKEEVADAAEKTLSDANHHTDKGIEETITGIITILLEFGQDAEKAISDGDATTLQSAQKYTDDAIDAIPTPDVSGQIEQHNTSPTAHPDIREILNTCVGLPEFNSKTYELTFTTIAGAKLIVGLPGPSAYDLYKKHNPDAEISEEEYANAPIDAADAANEAAKAANEAVDKIGDINEALAGKVDKEEGKGLSSNDYTDDDKEKLDGLSNYDDTEIRVQLSEKASKEEVADAAEKTLSDANHHTDKGIEETITGIITILLEFGQDAEKAISDGDATTLQSAQKYTDDAIDAIPTPDVSGQIEQHNTSPTAHPDIREILNTCVGLPEFNSKTYELTFTTIAGAKLIVDLPIEQMGLEYNEETRAIEFINADGSISSIPVSDFVKVYVGSIGPEIQIAVDGSEIRATLLNNTVSWDKLTLTLQEVIEGKADRTEIPTKVSELENDSEFVTAKEIDPELRKTSFEVVAHSDCTLEERVAQLESLLVRMLSGDVLIPELQVKKLGVWGGNNIVVTGEGAPSKAPDRAGQFYIDTKNNAVYHSVGNNAVSDWKNN